MSFSFPSPQTRVGTFVVCPEKIFGTFWSFFSRMLVFSRCYAATMRGIDPFVPSHSHGFGMSRFLSCAHSHRLVSSQRQSILWRCCYFTSGNDLAWEGSSEKTMRLSLKLSTQGITGRGGDRRCDSGDRPSQGMGMAFPCSCRCHLLCGLSIC